MSQTTPFRDRIIPWYFVIFFVFLAIINGIMVTLAFDSFSGLVTEHPYEKGIAYNKVVEAAKKQAALGWHGRVSYENNAITYTLTDATKKPMVTKKATAYFSRPTQAGMDFSVPLTGETTAVTFPAQGLWEVRVVAETDEHSFQHSERIIVK